MTQDWNEELDKAERVYHNGSGYGKLELLQEWIYVLARMCEGLEERLERLEALHPVIQEKVTPERNEPERNEP